MIPVTETILQTAYRFRWHIFFLENGTACINSGNRFVDIMRIKEDLWQCTFEQVDIQLTEIGTIMFLKEKLRRKHAAADH